jgi:hypothetical protein
MGEAVLPSLVLWAERDEEEEEEEEESWSVSVTQGRVKKNVLPPPGTEVTPILPP